MNKSILITELFFLLLISFSCRKNEIVPIDDDKISTYIFISHTLTAENPNLNTLVEEIDFSKYDIRLLGGDIAFLSSQDTNTMQHIDNIFDVGNINTLWALGNHDYANTELISYFTNRELFYAYYKDNITFVVLDTQDSASSITHRQLQLLDSVVDTLNNTKYLILIHHKLIWMYGLPELELIANDVSNGQIGDCGYCINPNNFYQAVYPLLITAKNKNVEVYCIAGDIGKKAKTFFYKTNEKIHFVASGIWSSDADNQAIILTNNLTTKELNCQFKLLTEI